MKQWKETLNLWLFTYYSLRKTKASLHTSFWNVLHHIIKCTWRETFQTHKMVDQFKKHGLCINHVWQNSNCDLLIGAHKVTHHRAYTTMHNTNISVPGSVSLLKLWVVWHVGTHRNTKQPFLSHNQFSGTIRPTCIIMTLSFIQTTPPNSNKSGDCTDFHEQIYTSPV